MIQAIKNLQKMVCYRQSKCNSKYCQNNYMKFETESINTSLFSYSDVHILFTGDITVTVAIIQILHLKIIHYFLRVKEKVMTQLLMKQVIFTLQ